LSTHKDYAVIDIETTGGDPRRDRITEVAIYRFDGQQVIDSFVSLINPEVAIPEMITRITGIDNDMVREAPLFYEVARKIVEITEGCIFVAHNARFDYGFIQKEFRNLGYTFSRKMLCTLKLSRKRLPGLSSYSLKNLCRELEIINESSHRAWGDAQATVKLLKHLLAEDEHQLDKLKLEIASAKLPPNLLRSVIESLPNATGVYYFHNEEGRVIYTGKSSSIRKRILSHFQAAHKTKRGMRMFEQIRDISFELTGSELIALLLENEEIKRLQPTFNRAQRRTSFRYAIYSKETKQGFIRLWVEKLKRDASAVAYFSTQLSADGALKRQAETYELCPKLCGFEQGAGRCFHYQLHICRGACVQAESPDNYNERVQQAMIALNYGQVGADNYLIIDEGRDEDERSVICIEKGVYCGHAYFETTFVSGDPKSVRASIPFKAESPDVQRIIQAYLRRNEKKLRVVGF